MVLSLGAALGFAVAAALKHASAEDLGKLTELTPTALGRFVRATVSHRLWWAGTGMDVIAVALHVSALHQGALAVVQPLLVTVLVFGIAIRAVGGRRFPRRELTWAVVLTLALAGFLAVAGTSSATPGADVDRLPAAVAGAVGVVLASTCVGLARARFAHGAAAALYGVAAGIAYATTAALLKTLTMILNNGVGAVLSSWQLYAAMTVGGVGLVLTQLAYQAGPLVASLPAITIVNPLLSIAIGVIVYDEDITHQTPALIAMVCLLSFVGWSVFQLTTLNREQPGSSARAAH